MFANWYLYNVVALENPFSVLDTTVQFFAGPLGFLPRCM